jgi:hypothetical protein
MRSTANMRPKAGKSSGLAIDQPSAVRKFLQRTPVTFPIGLAGLEGTELGKALGNTAGGLPFTVVLARMAASASVEWAAVSEPT